MTAVILCGGAGTRLWPVSRKAKPKQFCDLLGGKTLFERTVERNAGLSERIIIVANRAHYEMAAEQAAGVLGPDRAVEFILEPVGRNTASVITLTCLGHERNDMSIVIALYQIYACMVLCEIRFTTIALDRIS